MGHRDRRWRRGRTKTRLTVHATMCDGDYYDGGAVSAKPPPLVRLPLLGSRGTHEHGPALRKAGHARVAATLQSKVT